MSQINRSQYRKKLLTVLHVDSCSNLRVLFPTSDSLGAQVSLRGSNMLPSCFDASQGSSNHDN